MSVNQRSVTVIVPTYNEVLNIDRLVKSIFEQKRLVDRYNLSVIVVDSSSPDGTADRAKELAKKYPISLISTPKEGLGRAYYKAFSYVLAHSSSDYIVQMDCDLSHPASKLPAMLNELERGADVVIGSRYMSGGFIPGDWPLLRIINSVGSRFVARFIGGIPTEIHDPTAGYRAMRKESLKAINLNDRLSDGYVFTIKTLNDYVNAGLKIVESPIHFPDRTHGESKIRMIDVFQFVLFCVRMRVHSWKRIASGSDIDLLSEGTIEERRG